MSAAFFRWLMKLVFAKEYAAMKAEHGVDCMPRMPEAVGARAMPVNASAVQPH